MVIINNEIQAKTYLDMMTRARTQIIIDMLWECHDGITFTCTGVDHI